MATSLLAVALLAGTLADGGPIITAGVPALVTQKSAGGVDREPPYMYFPQTLHWAGAGNLLLSYQNDSDALHDAGWTGRDFLCLL